MKKNGNIIDRLKNGLAIPTRHQNPYISQALLLEDNLYTAKEFLNRQNFLFVDKKEIIIEIGCYTGKNIIELAMQNQDFNFIGLEITYKRAVQAAKKIQRQQLKNAKIIICDAHSFLELLNMKILGICIFFPDPWPKLRHEKNRLLNDKFIILVKEKLKSQGFFWLKTDSNTYFQHTEKLLCAKDFRLASDIIQPSVLLGGPYETLFEIMFRNKQITYYQGVYLQDGN